LKNLKIENLKTYTYTVLTVLPTLISDHITDKSNTMADGLENGLDQLVELFQGEGKEADQDDQVEGSFLDADNQAEGSILDADSGTPLPGNMVTPPTKKKKNRTASTFVPPTLAELYEMDPAHVSALSSEKGFRAIWIRWDAYHKSCGRDGESWSKPFGLGLYGKRPEADTDPYNFDKDAVIKFFQFLEKCDVGKTVMEKAKTFCNAHLRCENYNRLKDGPGAQLVEVSVGRLLMVKDSVRVSNSRAASKALSECLDIQAGLEVLIAPKELRIMTEYVFQPKPGGRVSKMNLLNRIYFACHYHTLNATTRRGEELYAQKLIQRGTTFFTGDWSFWNSSYSYSY
jgi:hypothetical protein